MITCPVLCGHAVFAVGIFMCRVAVKGSTWDLSEVGSISDLLLTCIMVVMRFLLGWLVGSEMIIELVGGWNAGGWLVLLVDCGLSLCWVNQLGRVGSLG